jgi:hypothetical protein
MRHVVLVDTDLPAMIAAMIDPSLELRRWPEDAPAEVMQAAVGIFTYGLH